MKKFVLILAALILLQSDYLYASSLQVNALSFIGSAPVPDEARKVMTECISRDSNASEWFAEGQNNIYSLHALEIPRVKSGRTFAQNTIDRNYTRRAELMGQVSIAEYIDKGKLDRKIFQDKDAANYALRVYYQGKVRGGFQSVSRIIDDTALSLVWTAKNNSLAAPVPESEITANYCSYLYEKAQYLFKNKNFDEALKTFHQIHYMKWANISAYLGASACFLHMKQNDDAAKLVSELVNVFNQKMTPDEMSSAGKILFMSGRKDEGFNALEKAYEMLKAKIN